VSVEIVAIAALVVVLVAILEGIRAARHPLLTTPKAERKIEPGEFEPGGWGVGDPGPLGTQVSYR
jgi:hypothetical protein